MADAETASAHSRSTFGEDANGGGRGAVAGATGCEYTPRQMARARDALSHAARWREANTEAWAYADARFRQIGATGRRISVQRIFEDVRAVGELAFADARGGRFSVNNTHVAAFARMLCHEHPEYARLVELRQSAFDALLGEAG